ncbi:MAG: hypothetical protein AB7U98_14905 [Candidatus Nitrosocosmicus sp.]
MIIYNNPRSTLNILNVIMNLLGSKSTQLPDYFGIKRYTLLINVLEPYCHRELNPHECIKDRDKEDIRG